MWKKCVLILLTVLVANFHPAKAIISKVLDAYHSNIDATKYQVSIRIKENDKNFGHGHICGGSILTHRTILTAAHCLYTRFAGLLRLRFPHELRIVMGSVERLEKTKYTLVFDVDDIDHHVKYQQKEIRFDLGLIFLKGSIPVNYPTAQPIPLTNSRVPEGTKCTVSGWGRISESGPTPAVLLSADVNMVDFNDCEKIYGSFWGPEIRKGMVCASQGACYGDSGGPLACDGVLVGIVSWGRRCGATGYPSVYTDVYHFRNWILENGAVINKHVMLVELVAINLILLLITFRYNSSIS